MKRFNKRKGGFTLIELMIVVAIIGILAAIAIPNFLRFQLKAKSSEGKTNLAAIRTAEESYYSEFGVYVSAFPTPVAFGKNVKIEFDNTPTNGLNKGFDRLGWSPEGYVFFNYAVGMDASFSMFTATASADIDADAAAQTWGYHKGTAAAKTGHTCVIGGTGLFPPETVGPCESAFGQSVF
jgi:type IV pilus assembly protein PilA